MAFELSQAKADKLFNFLNEAKAVQGVSPDGATGAFASAYQFLTALLSVDANGDPIYTDADMATINPVTWVSPDRTGWQQAGSTTIGDPEYLDPASYVFLSGVDAVNANDTDSAFNIFIRAYTAEQFTLRFGEDALPPRTSSVAEGIQNASDDIAQNIIEDILGLEDGITTPNGTFEIPDAERIAFRDAQAEMPRNSRWFSKQLERKGIISKKTRIDRTQQWCYVGIKIRGDNMPDPPEQNELFQK